MRLTLPRKKLMAIKHEGRPERRQVGGISEALPVKEAYGKDENERKLEEERQKKFAKNVNLAKMWKVKMETMIAAKIEEEKAAKVGLVFDKTWEKPDGHKDVFVTGKNG